MRVVVSAPVCPLWTAPGPEGVLADQALLGMVLEVLEEPAPGWRRVRTPYRYEGYAPVECLNGEADRWEARPKRVVLHKNAAPILAGAAYQARCLLTVPLGAILAPVGEVADGWQGVALPDGTGGYVRAGWLDVYHEVPIRLPERELRQRLVETALRYRYAPYRWGGKTPVGIDCSGLVSMTYLLNGITIYRDARLEPGFDLVEIAREEMDAGDVLFFPGHVALYLGDGRYVHATGRAGSDGVCVNSLRDGDPDYRSDLAQALTQVGSYVGFHP